MKNEIREELEALGSGLVDIGNENPFSVPPNYFKELSIEGLAMEQAVPRDYFSKLSEKVLEEVKPKSEAKVIRFNFRKWAAAASIVGICMVAYFSLLKTDEVMPADAFASLDVELEEALDYLIENDEINISEVMELTQLDIFEEEESNDLEGDDFESILDEMTLEDLDELL